MRRMALIAAVVGAASGLAGCAGQDSVIFSGGPGEVGDGNIRVLSIYAVSGPSGESAGGRVVVEVRVDTPRGRVYGRVGGPVTCLAVQGNSAIINFDDQMLHFGITTVAVHDANPDTFGGPFRLLGRAPDDCSSLDLNEQSLVTGHISVVDSQPPSPSR